MQHKRIPKTKLIVAGAGVAAVAAAAIILPNANASQSDQAATEAKPKVLTASQAQELASQLEEKFGSALAGAFWDKGTGNLIINVVDQSVNNNIEVSGEDNDVSVEVKKAGAAVRDVKNSTEELKAGASTLAAKATIPGTSWAVDPKTNQILVTADSTVTGAKWNRLESTVKSLGTGMARIQKSAGTFKTFASGGDAIFGGGARCSLGFNVTASDGSPAFLTAGHCGVAADTWSDSETGAPIATVEAATFPGDGDFALVKYDDPATEAPSDVNVGNGQTVAITEAAEATVGEQVLRMGSTTGLNDGQVLGLDATVNYPEGTVTGLIQTDVCAEPGDSGGSLFTEDGKAIGLTSGGSGDCTQGGETFFQPVTTALEATGATLGDAGAGDEAGAGDQAGAGGEAGAGDEAAAGGAAGAGADDQATADPSADPSASAGGDEQAGAEDQNGAEDQAGDGSHSSTG